MEHTHYSHESPAFRETLFHFQTHLDLPERRQSDALLLVPSSAQHPRHMLGQVSARTRVTVGHAVAQAHTDALERPPGRGGHRRRGGCRTRGGLGLRVGSASHFRAQQRLCGSRHHIGACDTASATICMARTRVHRERGWPRPQKTQQADERGLPPPG